MAGNKRTHNKPELDRVIHEPARLQIISYLATGGPEIAFSELGEKLSLSSGNLSVQLKKLEEAGYLSIVKSFKDNRPLTSVTITRSGMEALKLYLNELEKMIGLLKTAMPDHKND
jgi:DNA-binding MarR family transcriptional regulator